MESDDESEFKSGSLSYIIEQSLPYKCFNEGVDLVLVGKASQVLEDLGKVVFDSLF